MTKKFKSAADLIADLEKDENFKARNAERVANREHDVASRLEEIALEQDPILEELAVSGIKVRSKLLSSLQVDQDFHFVRSISDLINAADPYPNAIPILVKHLKVVKNPILIEALARALTCEEARDTEASDIILGKLKQSCLWATKGNETYQAKWALANALTIIGSSGITEELKNLASDPNFLDVVDRITVALNRRERRLEN